jgi:hypothetical protein
MERIYLYVSPEEYAEVKASGACWDDQSKSWYIDKQAEPAAFARWLGDEEGGGEFGITSEAAFVARAPAICSKCHERIEVICLYCDSAVDTEMGEAIARVTLSNVWGVDEALAKQLENWPDFRKGIGEEYFANHCPHCGTIQEDYLLHSEPEDVFFGLAPGRPGPVEFTPIEGRIQVSGDYGFEV